MAYPFDANYYLQSKLAQLKNTGEKDANGNEYTEASLLQVLNNFELTPQQHYEQFGQFEGLNANPYFNANEYLQAKVRQLNSFNQDGDQWTVKELSDLLTSLNLTPIEHYVRYGALETDANGNYINPSNAFDVNAYFSAKLYQLRDTGETVNGRKGPAITMDDLIGVFKGYGISPVEHYIQYGRVLTKE